MKLTQQQLEAHLLGAANILRGRTAGQDYKNYILSLMFYKRLCDQWEQETDDAIADLEAQQARPLTEQQRAIFRQRGEHRFSIPVGAHWGDVKAAATNLGEVLTTAMRAVANSNEELRGVFTVDWNQPAPDASGKPLIPNEVVHALIQHFDEHNLSNKSVPQDVLGRAYEYLIKYFADDAGAKAGEFFTPPEVVDVLVRMLEPKPGDTIYDPTCGSGGMLVHSADYLREQGHHATSAQYFGQEMNWSNAAISKINSVLHGLDAEIKAGSSTITDPQFFAPDGGVRRFSVVLANFPFSDDSWWLRPEQQTDDKKKKAGLRKEILGTEGYKDQFGRFGRGTAFRAPPAEYGDYAFVLHILASVDAAGGRAAIVCPQGVLFRGQPAVEEETGELGVYGTPRIRRRKADDEHLIRRTLIETGYIDAVVSLPLNVFYGAGVPACLLILRRDRPPERTGKVLLVYAARHFRELAAQNELRPQDVMRLLVYYHAYGDPSKVAGLVDRYRDHIARQIASRQAADEALLIAEYQPFATVHERTQEDRAAAESASKAARTAAQRKQAEKRIAKADKEAAKARAKLSERDERIADVRRMADDDRGDVDVVGVELVEMYKDPEELLRHARVVALDELAENDFNLNIPRYLDTFEPEPALDLGEAVTAFRSAEVELANATHELFERLEAIRRD